MSRRRRRKARKEERRDERAKVEEVKESGISKRGQQTDWEERKTDTQQQTRSKMGLRVKEGGGEGSRKAMEGKGREERQDRRRKEEEVVRREIRQREGKEVEGERVKNRRKGKSWEGVVRNVENGSEGTEGRG